MFHSSEGENVTYEEFEADVLQYGLVLQAIYTRDGPVPKFVILNPAYTSEARLRQADHLPTDQFWAMVEAAVDPDGNRTLMLLRKADDHGQDPARLHPGRPERLVDPPRKLPPAAPGLRSELGTATGKGPASATPVRARRPPTRRARSMRKEE